MLLVLILSVICVYIIYIYTHSHTYIYIYTYITYIYIYIICGISPPVLDGHSHKKWKDPPPSGLSQGANVPPFVAKEAGTGTFSKVNQQLDPENDPKCTYLWHMG